MIIEPQKPQKKCLKKALQKVAKPILQIFQSFKILKKKMIEKKLLCLLWFKKLNEEIRNRIDYQSNQTAN